MNTRRIYFGW